MTRIRKNGDSFEISSWKIDEKNKTETFKNVFANVNVSQISYVLIKKTFSIKSFLFGLVGALVLTNILSFILAIFGFNFFEHPVFLTVLWIFALLAAVFGSFVKTGIFVKKDSSKIKFTFDGSDADLSECERLQIAIYKNG